jgi:RNA polymerase sigma-70 factor (ECF subfamily)
MLHVSVSEEAEAAVSFKIEGKLVGDSCAIVRNAYRELDRSGKKVLFDLSGVTFIDRAGTILISELLSQPNELASCSEYIRAILEYRETIEGRPAIPQHEMLKRLRDGDEDAFEVLVREFGGRMLAIARRFFTCDADSRDVVQEAWIAAYKAIRTFKGDSSLATWLHRIVINAALMSLRAKRRRPVEAINHLLPRFDAEGHWISHLEDATAAPIDSLEHNEIRATVRHSIEHLPEAYRIVLIMHDLEGLEKAEVARNLNISCNAVKIRLHRGRQALKTLLERSPFAR